jgi:hypothetical protein
MSSFLGRLLLFLLFFGALLYFPQFLMWQKVYEEDILNGLRVAQERLETTKDEPRFIIQGGSSNAYGINSKLLQDSMMSKYQVVNLATVGGVGVEFMLAHLRQEAKSGDFILFALEPGTPYPAPVPVMRIAKELHPSLDLSIEKSPEEIFKGVLYLERWRLRNTWDNIIYGRAEPGNPRFRHGRAFNNYGDQTYHLDKAPMKLKSYQLHLERSLKYRKDLADFVKWCDSSGVKLVFGYVPRTADLMERCGDVIDAHYRILDSIAPNNFVGQQAAYVYPESLFFDDHLHLHVEGRDKHTQQLLQDLKLHIQPR